VFGFSRDGTTVYVVRRQSSGWELAAIDVNTGATRKTTALSLPPTNEVLGFSLSPDGSHFATSVSSTKTDIWVMEDFAGPARR
jgi:dipeptidyl aminopeptidase/acylaminoacyl peptidase